MKSITQLSSVSHKYSVKKTFHYGTACAEITLYADLVWGVPTSRSVTMNREYTGLKGSWVTYSGTGDKIIQAVGTTNVYAIAEAWGQFTLHAPELGDYFTRSYRIQLLADPADSSGVILNNLIE